MKRFTLRKVKQHSYSRQGWKLKDLGYVFAIYDREWRKRIPGYICGIGQDFSDIKYIDNARSKEVAQYWADWLNANCADNYSRQIFIPSKVFQEGLELYK